MAYYQETTAFLCSPPGGSRVSVGCWCSSSMDIFEFENYNESVPAGCRLSSVCLYLIYYIFTRVSVSLSLSPLNARQMKTLFPR